MLEEELDSAHVSKIFFLLLWLSWSNYHSKRCGTTNTHIVISFCLCEKQHRWVGTQFFTWIHYSKMWTQLKFYTINLKIIIFFNCFKTSYVKGYERKFLIKVRSVCNLVFVHILTLIFIIFYLFIPKTSVKFHYIWNFTFMF